MRRYLIILMIFFSLFIMTADIVCASALRIAIQTFTNDTGDEKLDFLTDTLPDRLSEKLLEVEEIELVERKRIKEVLSEMQLHQTGAVDERTVSRLGKLLGAEKLLYGNIFLTELGRKPEYKLSIRMVDVESSRLVKSWSSSGKQSDFVAMVTAVAGGMANYIKSEVALRNLAQLIQTKPPFKIELWTDKKRCKIGETITIYFRSEKDCYLTLIDITTSGKLYVLFPNHYATDNHIKAGRTYTIPGPDHPFVITIGEPKGFERLKAIATLNSVDLWKTKVGKDKQLFINMPDPSKATRGLNIVITNIPKLTWSDAYHEVIIE